MGNRGGHREVVTRAPRPLYGRLSGTMVTAFRDFFPSNPLAAKGRSQLTGPQNRGF